MIPVQQAMAFSDGVDVVNREALERIAKTLAAEVRRLREENERQQFDILAMNQSLDLLREENERLRGWIRVEGGCNDTCTRQILGEICDGCRCGKAQKDAARGAK